MIKRLETTEEIAALLEMPDDAEDEFPCSRGEWIQWLISQVDNPKVAVWGGEDGYAVAVNVVNLPVSNHIAIIYRFGSGKDKEALDRIKEWAKEMGAKSIRELTKDMDEYHDEEFQEIYTMMEMKI